MSKGLLKKELKVGNIYRCLLSGKYILITYIEFTKYNDVIVKGKYYNHINGNISIIGISNNQLIDLEILPTQNS